MIEPEWRQAAHILVVHAEALGPELVERGIHVDRVPEHDDVHHKTERTELVLLALVVALPQFAALAVKDGAGELLPTLGDSGIIGLSSRRP